MVKVFLRFCEEPYRIFFPLAVLCGMFGIGHWLAYAAGWIDHYSGFMHASIQMQVYMICFIAGFLMTAMPRLSGTAPASWIETCGLMSLILGILVSLSLSNWLMANLFFVTALVWLLRFGIRRIQACRSQAKVKPPVEFLWVPIALLHGIGGSILLMTGTSKVTAAWTLSTGKSMVQQGMVLAVVLGVGGFLAPRLMGTFKAVKPLTGPCCEIKQEQERRRDGFLHLLAGVVLFSSFFLEGLGWIKAAYAVRALLAGSLMIWTRSLVFKPVTNEQYVRLLWFSLWMVFLGSWAAFLFPAHRVALMHLVFLGGYSLMTFAVATMVITSHAGRPEQLRRPSKVLSFVAVMVSGAVVFRVVSGFFPAWYFQLLGVSSLLWLAGGAVWLMKLIPLVLVVPPGDEMSKMHEDARRRVLNLRKGRGPDGA